MNKEREEHEEQMSLEEMSDEELDETIAIGTEDPLAPWH